MQRLTILYIKRGYDTSSSKTERTSFSNHVGTALRTNPYFMALVGVDVESITNIALLFLWIRIVRIA